MTDPRNKLIGDRVRYYRTSKGWSLDKLATSIENPLSGQQLAKYETGVSRWPTDLVCDIAVTMRVDVRLLVGLESGKHEGKETDEWEAEKYKNLLLGMPRDFRSFMYNTINMLIKLNKE